MRSAIASALDDADFDIDTDKARFTKELAADLLDAIIRTDGNIECFDRFAEVLRIWNCSLWNPSHILQVLNQSKY